MHDDETTSTTLGDDMATYLLNSAVLTGFGDFTYRSIEAVEARKVLEHGFTSAVGHQATADYCTRLLQIEVPFNRIEVAMQPGDVAVVVRVKGRLPEARTLTDDAIREIGCEIGLLSRVATSAESQPVARDNQHASPGKVRWMTRSRGVANFLWRERRMFLLVAVLLSLISVWVSVHTTGNWTSWNTWDIFLTLATFGIGVAVFWGESIEDWEERLPKRVTVYFQTEGRTRMVCYLAHLAHEGDIRNWGQQIGSQMCGMARLDLRPLFNVRRTGVQQTSEETYTCFEAVIYLRSLPDELEKEFANAAAAQQVPQDSLCKVLRTGHQGTEKISFENSDLHVWNEGE